MELKNILIVVKDIEKSKQFYNDLFGLDLVLDNDGNMILTEGLVLQDEKIWKKFLGKDIIPKNNSCELYFEERDIEAFVEKLERSYPSIQYLKFVWTSLMRRLRQYTTRTNQRQPGIFSTMVFKVSKVSSIWSTTCLPWLTISVICSVRGCGSA